MAYRTEAKRYKEIQEVDQILLTSANKRITSLGRDLKNAHGFLRNLGQERDPLHNDKESLEVSLNN